MQIQRRADHRLKSGTRGTFGTHADQRGIAAPKFYDNCSGDVALIATDRSHYIRGLCRIFPCGVEPLRTCPGSTLLRAPSANSLTT